MAYHKRFSLPRNDEHLAASLREIIADLKDDIPRLEKRVEHIRVARDRIDGEEWGTGWNVKKQMRERMTQDPLSEYAARVLGRRKVAQSWNDGEEVEEGDGLVMWMMKGGSGRGPPPGVNPSLYIHHNDDKASSIRSSHTTISLNSHPREPFMSGANGSSPSLSHSLRKRIPSHWRHEADAASLHRKKDSGNAEFMDGADDEGSVGGDDAGEAESGGEGKKKGFRQGLESVLHRGRPNRAGREARTAGGLPIR
ncbi:hypothetical protein K458DRAFT_489789 [Lentithecium fluviatile CBS 122367]|uniref:Uncharacterized protein n=1 Tax=Lentithecium fluviatile CBS 122367 TaxID=1168545 RepID=A0A6G1IQY5_9PLEO|nr:hypothetical protein K458DRAFT_489789 [Lentithecium fluviatile CBS 122367]